MLDIRKFPLLHAALPFLIGLIICYSFHWSAILVVCFAFPLLAMAVLVGTQTTPFSDKLLLRKGLFYSSCLLTGVLVFSVHDYRLNDSDVSRLASREVIITGELSDVKKGIGGKQQLLLTVENRIVEDSITDCSGKVNVLVMDDAQIFDVGDEIMVSGKLLPITNSGNPGEFDAVSFYASRKVGAVLFTPSIGVVKTGSSHSINAILMKWRGFLASKMEQELEGTFLAIAKALILGDKSDLDAETMNAFSSTGSMHVLAVSGLHIGLILMLIQRLLRLFSRWITKRKAIVIAIVLIWMYGGITGASPAVMRAVVMFSILSAAQLLYRQVHALNTLGFSAIVLLCFDPWMLFDLGFQLSYAAMFGIFLFYRSIVDVWIPSTKWVQFLWEGTAVGIAATILTTPLILLWFYQFPNYFVLANLGVMLFGFLVLLLGMVFLMTVWIPYVVKLVSVLFAFSVFGMVGWVKWVDSLPGAVSGGFQLQQWEVMVAYLIIALWIYHLQLKKISRIWLILPSLALISWWMFQRSTVLQSRELVVFNSNQFVAAVKENETIIGFYDKKWTGSWKIPRELEAYARYSGCKLKILPLYHQKTAIQLTDSNWELTKVEDGVVIRFNRKKWFYRTEGTPEEKENRRLMTTRIQQFENPELPTNPFIHEF